MQAVTSHFQSEPVRRFTPQSLEAAHHPDALLRMQTVVTITGLSASTIYRLLGDKTSGFPAAIRRGARCTRFRAGDIVAWLQTQAAK